MSESFIEILQPYMLTCEYVKNKVSREVDRFNCEIAQFNANIAALPATNPSQLVSYINDEIREINRETHGINRAQPQPVQPVMKIPRPPRIPTYELYWCLFIAGKGLEEYTLMQPKSADRAPHSRHTNVRAQTALNLQIVEFIGLNKSAFKSTSGGKITGTAVAELMSDLMTNLDMSCLKTMAMCVYFKIRAVIIDQYNNTFVNYNPDTTNNTLPVFVLTRKGGKYAVNVATDLAQIYENMVQLECGNKPLKGISSYKLGELQSIAAKIKTDVDLAGLKKQPLYDALCQIFGTSSIAK